tara:strand:- start:128 stop:310 length:183 start_codon:yes stop_codon:yes gene_type:complete
MDFIPGDIVELYNNVNQPRKKAVVIAINHHALFDSVKLVKIMIVGASAPTHTLSDRMGKL